MIPLNAPSLGPLEEQYVLEALRSGWITGGPFVDRFEQEFAAWVGRSYAVACASGTAALILALMAVTPRRVLAPTYTCDAVANAVWAATRTLPILADVDGETWGLDVGELPRGAELGATAVILVHTYGVPARDTLRFVEDCRTRGIVLIEDASEAHGAMLTGHRVGGFGDLGVFSLRGEKNLGAGQLGVTVTDRADWAKAMRQVANNGLPDPTLRYWSTRHGLNLQPPHLSAALALAQLHRADELIAARNRVAVGWRRLLPEAAFQVPHGTPAWWLTAVRFPSTVTRLLPQDLAYALRERGVQTRPGFYPLHWLPHLRTALLVGPCPMAERLLQTLLILPSGPAVTEKEQVYVTEQIREILGTAPA